MHTKSSPSIRILTALGCYALTGWLAGCASDPISAAPPKSVDLTGEWQINQNLSDDPDKPAADDSGPAPSQRHRGGAGRGGGAGGPGGLGLPGGAGGPASSPPDELENFTGGGGGAALLKGAADEPAPVPSPLLQIGPPGGGGGKSPRSGNGSLLDAPDHMTITQSGNKVTIQSRSGHGDLTTDEYVVGQQTNIPFADSTADRTVGWRDNVFVVDTKIKSGPEKELDFALDEDGRLIVATLLTGRHVHKADVKYVYDRVKPSR